MNTLIDGHVHVWQAGSLQTAWLEKAPYCDDPGWAPLRGAFPAEARMAVFQFIEGWYNPGRRHSALGYLSPITFERSALQQLKSAGP